VLLHLIHAFVQLQAPAKLGHQGPQPVRGLGQLALAAGIQRGLDALGQRLLGLLARRDRGPALDEALPVAAQLQGHRAKRPQRARRERGQFPFRQLQPVPLRIPCGLDLADLRLELRHAALQRADPILLLREGLDARALAQHRRVDRRSLGLGAELVPLALQLVPELLPLLQPGIEPVEALGVGRREVLHRAQGGQLLVEGTTLLEARAHDLGDLQQPDLVA